MHRDDTRRTARKGQGQRYANGPSVEVPSWTRVEGDVEIKYLVFPNEDTIEFTLGSYGELEMITSEAGLRHCLMAFTHALDAFQAAATQSGKTPSP